ncbi:unnamed protein product [Ostreobium quekettii]|uniref:glucose-6-phosphate 1-epimerase n=1 Tax=Ostreobium quekettii TaxID=121088 RepID=A0A8S1IMD0_9CHLO|nr:unnamed protein product [Ostreobium quekettii]
MAPNLVTGDGDLPKVVLRCGDEPGGDKAEVYLHGAHVTSWIPEATGKEMIFVSKDAIFKPPKAIRGGVPVCFPQFSDMGPLGAHGFARNSAFEVQDGESDQVTLALRPSEEDLERWPQKFELRITVALSPGCLTQTMEVQNMGSSAMEFTCALHTYFRVEDVTNAQVKGLRGLTYLDNLQSRERFTEANACVEFSGEVDRIYCGAPDTIDLVDGAAGHSVVIEKTGFPDAVVWNPWVDKAASLKDFGDEEYKEMVCIEPAVAGSDPISLDAGKMWTAVQKFMTR